MNRINGRDKAPQIVQISADESETSGSAFEIYVNLRNL